jgi:K+-transporting ATPase ATPase C chain
VVVSGIYPVLIWGVGELLFSHQANGSLVESNGQIVGSELLAQGFSGAKYFHPRPSDAGTGYDPTSSGGSNLGPTSQKLMDTTKANIDQYRQDNGLSASALVPVDAVTASGSGLESRCHPGFGCARRSGSQEAVRFSLAGDRPVRSGSFRTGGPNSLNLTR